MSVIMTGVVLWVQAGTLKFWSNCDRERYLPRLSSFVILIYECISFEDFVLYSHLLEGSVVKNLPANAGDAGDTGSIPGVRKIP